MAQSQQILKTLPSFSLETYLDPELKRKKGNVPTKLTAVKNSRFSVDFQLLYEVHGGYDPGDEDNASLLVIRVIPRPDDIERQFISFKLTLDVLPEGRRRDENKDSGPLLASFEPASSGDQFFDVYTVTHTRETARKGNLQAQMYGAGAGAEVARMDRSEFKTHHYLRVTSGTDRTNMSLSGEWFNRVWWNIHAAKQGDGIGDSFTVALLVKRPKGSRFSIEASTDGKIGVLSEKFEFIRSGFCSKKEPSCLRVFGPAKAGSVQKLPKGVDEKNLHAASTDEVMKGIDEVGLHLPEQGRPVKYEQGGTMEHQLQSSPLNILQSGSDC